MLALTSCSDSLHCCSSLTGSPSPEIQKDGGKKEKFSWFFRLQHQNILQDKPLTFRLYCMFITRFISALFIVEPGKRAPGWATPVLF